MFVLVSLVSTIASSISSRFTSWSMSGTTWSGGYILNWEFTWDVDLHCWTPQLRGSLLHWGWPHIGYLGCFPAAGPSCSNTAAPAPVFAARKEKVGKGGFLHLGVGSMGGIMVIPYGYYKLSILIVNISNGH